MKIKTTLALYLIYAVLLVLSLILTIIFGKMLILTIFQGIVLGYGIFLIFWILLNRWAERIAKK